MIVGTAISELVDPEDKRMIFSSEHINSTDGQWYRGLTSVDDALGSVADLPGPSALKRSSAPLTKPAVTNGKAANPSMRSSDTSKIVSIEEIDDSSESEEDLPMYEKPDSDESDEDEDPTLVQREKPTAPV